MKKKLTIILSVFIVGLIGAILAVHKSPVPKDILSEDEIAMLRESYPVNDGTPELVEMMLAPLERYIELCDSFIEVEVISKPKVYVKRYNLEIGSRFIIGGEYNIENDMLNISSNTMFYVTDDDYVLSVKSEESKNRYSSYKVEDFVEYIKKEISSHS